MVKVTNNWIIVSKDDPSFLQLSMNLSYTEKEKTRRLPNGREIRIPAVTNRLYTVYGHNMYIPVGVLPYLKDYFTKSIVVDDRIKSVDVQNIIDNIDNYADLLPGITLRKYQLVSLRKILFYKKCLVQISTGGGKTEVMCALVKALAEANGQYMTTLLMEPTIKLMNDICKRFEKYEIPIVRYSENRKIVPNCVNICHPISLGNDLENDPELLSEVQVLLADETHHLAAESFRRPTYSMNNLQYSVGVSASAISQEHATLTDISGYTYTEALVLGATGQLVVNVTSRSLIDSGSLADPVLFMVSNPADEPIGKNDIANWTKISQVRLESDHRTNLVVESAKFFHYANRKSLILVRTRRWAEKMLRLLYESELGDYARASFGGGVFEGYDGNGIFIDKEDVFKKFNNGEHTILIGTSHLYEGVDVPNLDVIILAYGGRGERLQVQGIGRVLRKTKSGKYAYIVDFTDDKDIVLSKHSRMRMDRYREVIGVPDDHIFYDINISDFKNIFDSLEG